MADAAVVDSAPVAAVDAGAAGAAGVSDGGAGAGGGAGAAVSALEANIARKGKNSYYYAHSKNLERHKTYKVSGGDPSLIAVKTAAKDKKEVKPDAVDSYSWSENKKKSKVKVYFTVEGSADLPEDSFELTWKPLSAKVVVTRTDGSRVAFIAKKLSNPIKDAKLTRSGDRITLVLFKIEDLQWFDLLAKD